MLAENEDVTPPSAMGSHARRPSSHWASAHQNGSTLMPIGRSAVTAYMAAGPPQRREAGTITPAAAVAALPERSVHCTVRVYRRPGPPPCLSARSRAVRSPVTWMSGAVFPSPSPFSGSLLVAETIRQAGG